MEIREIGQREAKAANNPGSGKQRGDKIGGTRRTALQGMKDLADRLLIVIGGASGNVGDVACARRFLLDHDGVGNLLRALGRAGEKVWRRGGGACGLVFFTDVERFLDRR